MVEPGELPAAWISRLSRMRREDRVYKPAMLLVALDLMDADLASPERVPLDLCAARFDALLLQAGLLHGSRGPGRAYYPIFHLSTSRAPGLPLPPQRVPFWCLVQDLTPREDIGTPSSLSALLRQANAAAFIEPLRDDAATREGRRRIRWAIYDLLEGDGQADSRALVRAHDPDIAKVDGQVTRLDGLLAMPFVLDDLDAERAVTRIERVVRARAFRQVVLDHYDHACALCSTRIRWGDRIEAQAAHIKPRALLGVDDVRNGLALCRTHHWAFDEGLWTAGDDLVVHVRPERAGGSDDLAALAALAGRELRPPRSRTAAPHPDALAWHRAVVFERLP